MKKYWEYKRKTRSDVILRHMAPKGLVISQHQNKSQWFQRDSSIFCVDTIVLVPISVPRYSESFLMVLYARVILFPILYESIFQTVLCDVRAYLWPDMSEKCQFGCY